MAEAISAAASMPQSRDKAAIASMKRFIGVSLAKGEERMPGTGARPVPGAGHVT